MALAFISYRRDDTSEVAQALYLQLKGEFGAGQLFMDAHSIRVGEAWPARIERRLADATVLLALIGPGWLIASDRYGRRRIDQGDDWVRSELLAAIAKGIPIIPVILDGLQNVPEPAGLPEELRALSLMQVKVLRRDSAEWSAGVRDLIAVLKDHGLEAQPLPPQPQKSMVKARTPALKPDEVAAALERLSEWTAWTDVLATEYPHERQELRRTFAFRDFTEAMEFMNEVAPIFEKAQHHPRWVNEWNIVRIRLTTWDVDNRITRYDVEMARTLDEAYEHFPSRYSALGAGRLEDDAVQEAMASLAGWTFGDGALTRTFELRNFADAFQFMTSIASIAERMDHHPEWSNVYNKVTIRLTTHDSGGVTEKDIVMAKEISHLAAS